MIVGGSRGLGAITAKMIAAGGGRVIVTYARGREDAECLSAEIQDAVGPSVSSVLPLDAMQPIGPQVTSLNRIVSHLYYLATPQIFVQKSEVFLPSLFLRFSRVYVEAFYETCMTLMNGTLSVFYPSSSMSSSDRKDDGSTAWQRLQARRCAPT